MELCDSTSDCLYKGLNIIADQSVFLAANNIVNSDERFINVRTPLAISLVTRIAATVVYHIFGLNDKYVNPIPDMSYVGVKGFIGAYTSQFMRKFAEGSRKSQAISFLVSNLLSLGEYFIFNKHMPSKDSNYFCDYSWKAPNVTVPPFAFPNGTSGFYRRNTLPPHYSFPLLLNSFTSLNNGALAMAAALTHIEGGAESNLSKQFFLGSLIPLFAHKLMLAFADQTSDFIKVCQTLDSKLHIPAYLAILMTSLFKPEEVAAMVLISGTTVLEISASLICTN